MDPYAVIYYTHAIDRVTPEALYSIETETMRA